MKIRLILWTSEQKNKLKFSFVYLNRKIVISSFIRFKLRNETAKIN